MKDSLIRSFINVKSYVILIKNHHQKESESLIILDNYSYKVNFCNKIRDGAAIAVKKKLQH